MPLSPSWSALLAQVRRNRASPIDMPAGLLVVLDIFDAGENRGDVIDFEPFERRFAELVAKVQPEARDKAWEPLFHLSRNGLWSLFKGHDPSYFDDRPKTRSALLAEADTAILTQNLSKELHDPAARRAIKDATYRMLADDAKDESSALIRAHRGPVPRTLASITAPASIEGGAGLAPEGVGL